MSGPVFYLMLAFCANSLLMMVISVPLIRGKAKINAVYGVRTPKTLHNERIWYPANAYGGRLLFRTGLGQILAIIAFALFPPIHANFFVYIAACVAVIFISTVGAAIRIAFYVKSL